jgi:multidrug efflux pump subunit AcrA (membrane-fusion protein)
VNVDMRARNRQEARPDPCACLRLIGEYTRKEVAEGYLTSSKGKVRIASPLAGKISEHRVHEGCEVRAGDVLYVVSAERDSLEAGATLANAALALQNRRASLINEKQKQLALAHMKNIYKLAVKVSSRYFRYIDI